ncbi:MAG: HD domain-containing phosphohydrolase [Chitinophagales bacterium]
MRLKKILTRKDAASLLDQIISNCGVQVAVLDEHEHLLVGPAPDKDWPREPIILDQKTVGWVACSNWNPMPHALVTFLVKKESETRALAEDTLLKYKEITLLHNITESISVSLELQEVAQLVVAQASSLIPATGTEIMRWNKEKGTFDTLCAIGTCFDPLNEIRPVSGICAYVLSKGKAEIINNISNDKRSNETDKKAASMICAPLKTKHDTMGIMIISSQTPREYTAGELRLLETLASQTAAAIQNVELYGDLRDAFFSTVQVLADAMGIRDPGTRGHGKRVMNYSLSIGAAMKLPAEEMARLKLASVLHDVGKIGIADNILFKARELTFEEQRIIKKHSEYGPELLKHVKQLRDIIPGVRGHHERYDGKGYPDGLQGLNIPLTARIIAVANAYDNLTSSAPGKISMDPNAAIKQISRGSGTEFDPSVVNVFINTIAKKAN